MKWLKRKYYQLKRWMTRDRNQQELPLPKPVPVQKPVVVGTGEENVVPSITSKAGLVLATLTLTASATGNLGSATNWNLNKIEKHQDRYEGAAELFSFYIPWEVIAVIHSLEASLNFEGCLHNGDRIIGTNRKTYNWPSGRGPFATWEESAYDAIMMKKNIIPISWTIGNTLDFLERYNGLGYRNYHKDVNSPYIWSGTNHYKKGKYVSDGKWSSSAVSKQVGAFVLLDGLNYFDKKDL